MRNKEILSKQKNKYSKIPSRIFQMDLHSFSISIFCYLASVSETFNPSLKNIAINLQISVPTVVKYIKVLERRNMIQKYEVGGTNRYSKYKFMPTAEWRKD